MGILFYFLPYPQFSIVRLNKKQRLFVLDFLPDMWEPIHAFRAMELLMAIKIRPQEGKKTIQGAKVREQHIGFSKLFLISK